MPGPIEVFISYAPEDVELRRELEQHLAVLKRQGLIRAWHVEQIGPGQGWRTAIESHVSTAQLILLLISAPFFASDDCHDLEMARALERWQRGEAQVVPVLLSQCLWETSQLRRLQPLPDNRVPVTSWPSRAEAWANVARGIHRIVERMAHGGTAAMPGAAVIPSRPAPTIPGTPIQEPPRASAPSYPVMGPPSPRASAPSYPVAAPPPARPSAPSAPPAWTPHHVASPPNAGAHSLRSSVPSMQPAQSAPRPSLDRVSASPRRSSPLPAVALALLALTCAAAGAFMIHRELSPSRASEDVEPMPVPLPATPSPIVSDPIPARTGARRAPEPELCAAPCCGGSMCAVDEQNTSKPVCVAGDERCLSCTSGRPCIPGLCGADLDPMRPVLLRLAHAVIQARVLGAGDQVCVRRSGSADPWSCVPCERAADTPGVGESAARLPLPLTVADLTWGKGVDIWVGTNGRVPTQKAAHTRAYHASINVTALCRGLRFKLYDAADPARHIGEVVFYLDDP